MAATNNTKSVDRTAIVGETTKLMFESDTLEDPRTRTRTVPFEVICPGMPRTGTSCKPKFRAESGGCDLDGLALDSHG